MSSSPTCPGNFADWVRVLRHVGTALLASAKAGPGSTPIGGITRAPQFTWFYHVLLRQVWRDVTVAAVFVLCLRRNLTNWPRWSAITISVAFMLRVRNAARRRRIHGAPRAWLGPPAVVSEGWTEEQAVLVKHLASQTYLLPVDQVDAVWGMGEESKGVSFTSRRYHLAFCFYSLCAAFQHEPTRVAEARRILDWLLDEMLNFKSWSYARMYWSDEQDPFMCSENIMWTGHVLAMVELYEALLGDARFRIRIVAIDDQGEEYVSSTPKLAHHIAKLYRDRPHGVCCEPGLVFFMCQNHPLNGLRIEQDLHPENNFDDIFSTWESYALNCFGAAAGGVFQFLQCNKVPVPIGHLAGDGWSFSYWPSWSPSLATVQTVWYSHLRPMLDPILDKLTDKNIVDPFAGPPSKGCLCLDMPRSATAAFLFSSAAVVGDNEVAGPLCNFVRSLQQSGDGSIGEGRDWKLASTAQLLLGLSAQRGATLRNVRNIGVK